MPRYDGTGPRGEGPFTGRGEGYCAIRWRKPAPGTAVVGFAGLQGAPVQPVDGPTTRGPMIESFSGPLALAQPRPWCGRRWGHRGCRRAGRVRW